VSGILNKRFINEKSLHLSGLFFLIGNQKNWRKLNFQNFLENLLNKNLGDGI
jgi:hypothetical protein